jgi:hypothetical protein
MSKPMNGIPPKPEPVVVGTAAARVMLDCGLTYLYRLINSRELESFRCGKARKITVRSINALVERKLTET